MMKRQKRLNEHIETSKKASSELKGSEWVRFDQWITYCLSVWAGLCVGVGQGLISER